MRRGTTPTLTLTVFGLSNLDLEEVWLTLRSGASEVVKHMSDMTIDGDIIRCKLSQLDTLALRGETVSVQLRFLETSGNAEATDIKETPLRRILTDGEITGGDTDAEL